MYVQADDAQLIIELLQEMGTEDLGLIQEASDLSSFMNKRLDQFETTKLLSGPYDKEGARVTISAGAGGTDAQVNFSTKLKFHVTLHLVITAIIAHKTLFFCTARSSIKCLIASCFRYP